MGSLKVSHSFVQELLSRVDIVEIVSHYVSLKQVGRNFTALCPFHPEKTPSFVVSPEKQIFKCFGCGVGGNAITFVEKYENLSFWEAVKRVAELAGVELPTELLQQDEAALKAEEFGLKAASYFHSKLDRVWDYLSSRGVSRETAKKFLLGYAPAGYLKELKIPKEEAQLLGLVGKNGSEFFRERLVIPIFNHSGKVVSFAGRALKEGKGPKYVNGPETPLFKKSSTLYGFYQCRDEILKKREVIVVEGYFDVISLYQLGVKRAVAPMGTSLTENHARFIKRYSPSPILLFDGDSAGRKAILRSSSLFFSLGAEPRVVQLPQGEDPDSMARNYPNELLELLNAPQPFLLWAVQTAKALDSSSQALFLKGVAEAVAPLKEINPFLYKEYLSVLSAEFGIDEGWLKVRSYRRNLGSSQDSFLPPPHHEKVFLKSLLENGYNLPIEISPNVFVSPLSSRLYSLISSGKVDLNELLQLSEVSDFVSELLFLEVSPEELRSSTCRVVAKELRRRLKQIKSFSEKAQLKRLIFHVEKGNLEALNRLQTT